MSVRIANTASGFDELHDVAPALAGRELVDYVTLCYLSDLTLPRLACDRCADRLCGHVPVFADVVAGLCPIFFVQGQLKLVTDAGATNPRVCAQQAGRILAGNGSPELPIAAVTGDDLHSALEQLLRDGHSLSNVSTGQPFEQLTHPIIAAHAWLGAQPIADALASNARIVISGPAGLVAPVVGIAAYEHGWQWDDWDRLAGATVAGKVLAGGACLAAGDPSASYATPSLPIGYPIAEIDADGAATISKQVDSLGSVTRETVAQQLLTGVRDPARYETPNVAVDVGSTAVTSIAANCVDVRAAKGTSPTGSYDVSVVYQRGFKATATLLVGGAKVASRAKWAAEWLFAQVDRAGFQLAQTEMELLAVGTGLPGLEHPPAELRQAVLYLAVRDDRRDAVERFAREVAAGVGGRLPGVVRLPGQPTPVEPALAVWPTRLPKDVVHPRVTVHSASQWRDDSQ